MENSGFDFDLHANNRNQVDNSQKIEIAVLGPGLVNLLVIYTGTAVLNWSLGEEASSSADTATIRIVLEEDFDSQYGRPLGLNLLPVPTFLAVCSEASKSASFIGADNDDWDFEIHPLDSQFTGLGAQTQVGAPLQITARVTNDERGTFGRISYQASVAVVAKAPPAPASGVCIDLPVYQNPPNQPPFNLILLDSDPSILGATVLEFIIDPPAGNGANRLLTFTGQALIRFTPSNDNQLTRGTVTIQFLRDLLLPDNFKSATGSATLTSIFNNDVNFDTTYAVNCVQVTPVQNGQMVLPTLTALVAVQGRAATTGTGISKLMYQANVEIAVGLQILVNANITNPSFQPTATVPAGGQWNFQLTLPTRARVNAPVQLASDPPAVLQNILPASFQVTPGHTVQESGPLSTNDVPPGKPVPVKITASLDGFTSTATLFVVKAG
jgi:hypothetical protein